MGRKTITLDSNIIYALEKRRFGGETWNEFFRRIMKYIPKREY